jgi:hypothetical protein
MHVCIGKARRRTARGGGIDLELGVGAQGTLKVWLRCKSRGWVSRCAFESNAQSGARGLGLIGLWAGSARHGPRCPFGPSLPRTTLLAANGAVAE